jgi:hypothetical protein
MITNASEMASTERCNVNPMQLGEAYVKALSEKDLMQIEKYVHAEMRFKSPMVECTGAARFLEAVEKLTSRMRSLRVRAKFSSENQAMFAYDIVFGPPIGVARAANLMTVEGEKIREMELVFDARPFAAMGM